MADIEKTDEEWRAELTPEQYAVCRCGGTEAPFTGKYWDTKTPGTYHCAGCDAPLFSSDTKYESGSGWPSFWDAIAPGAVAEKTDTSHGMVRTEILCAKCDSHLGHVFPDGPQPTGLRYCTNSASLRLEPSND
ncbi:peptide-methionine (R)-S-oxide reductase MsrB [Kordiimonas lipolytica]|uniref:Peptide methionine sulfoxide reductase MsrB n=1 Tax=Kordiimonas lipolytica TaxID=1662421 RepID=A0ABV8UAY2_9PROT|nr:peptide-methionine (R)-S-oxide reductase MsrB [Kordiimonas lipolytica]